MISLEQIRLLEQKVRAAVARIGQLKQENATLKEHLSSYQKRIDELEVLVESFKTDQGQIEEGILSALAQLDQLEEEVTQPATETSEPAHSREQKPDSVASAPAGEHGAETAGPSPASEPERPTEVQAPEPNAEEPDEDSPEEEEDEDDAGPELDIF
jgi:chromosome segregation ATPase